MLDFLHYSTLWKQRSSENGSISICRYTDTKENLLFLYIVWQMVSNVLNNYTTCILFCTEEDSMFLQNTDRDCC
jgi:hypothetical protein